MNGKTIHVRDMSARLSTPVDQISKSSLEDKKKFFEKVAEQIAIEDEARRTGFSIEKLFQFFSIVETVKVSKDERSLYLKSHPEDQELSENHLQEKIRSQRRAQVEIKYKAELKKRSTIRFMADNKKQSKVQEIWDKLSF